MSLVHLTVGQAIVRFLVAQHTERDGVEHRLIEGMFGILGHGNVAGLGAAVLESELADPRAMPYRQGRNEQGMVHVATAFARQRNRLSTLACLTSVGPGATNMVTGAATATINRLPVLLLPSDVFATRVADPVLQQLEHPMAGDVSVNDAFRPVARYFDRVWRPEQLPSALLGAMRVLTDPVETGAVVIALPEDVQVEAWDWPEELFARRVWHVPRPAPEPAALERAVAAIRASRRPLIVSGGGTIYSEATEALRAFVEATGIPVAETQAGKGSLPYDHPRPSGRSGRPARGGQRARSRGGPGHRDRDAVQRLHHGVADRIPAPGRAVREHQHRRLRRGEAERHRAAGRRPSRTRGALGQALAGWSVDCGLSRPSDAPRARLGRDGVGGLRAGTRAVARPDRGHRRGQRRRRPARRRGLRRGFPAGRPPQALADARPEGVPRRVRLLVHGLRGRGRHRRQARGARTRRCSSSSATARG